MDFEIITGEPAAITTDCLVVGVDAEGQLTPSAAALDKVSSGYIKALIDGGDLSGKVGELQMLHGIEGTSAKRVLIVGIGKSTERQDRHQRKIVMAIAKAVGKLDIDNAVIAFDGLGFDQDDVYRQVRHIVEWSSAALYSYDATKSEKAPQPKLEHLRVLLKEDDVELGEGALLDGVAIANGVSTARELGNLPANICTPSYLGKQAEQLAEEFDNVEIEILDEEQMAELGMNTLLSVGHGSEEPSRLIVIKYTGGAADEAPHVLVGKGITFDSGGISLKPGAGMDEMKFDMCGAASVIGTLEAAAEMQLSLNIIGIVAAAENMPSGKATKPGDIITTMSGQTVEILNTDAEGRLVLSDALTYAGRFTPASVIDIATLTGACIIALGHQATGLMSNNQTLADALLDAGEYASDRTWQLPLWDDFQEQLDSNFADFANIGGRPAGTITAGCFLSRFTKEYNWAHLDIAGVAWNSGKEKGATGRCVPLLSQYLLDLAEQKDSEEEHGHVH